MPDHYSNKTARSCPPDAATCSRHVAEQLARIDRLSGNPVFVRVFREQALAQAARLDQTAPDERGALWGLTVSVKDMFDVAQDATRGGSARLRNNPPATQDAAVVARLRSAGGIIIGKTNMAELAYSGLGLNPHFGDPRNARDPACIPGGSSSGAAVSVALDLADIALGSDTGGSIRVPAALNGVVGFKPSQASIPRQGMLALSHSQDTVGLMAGSVQLCAQAYAAATADASAATRLPARSVQGIRVAVPDRYLVDDLHPDVAQAFQHSLERMAAAGAQLLPVSFEVGALIAQMLALGGIVGPEAYEAHRQLLDTPDELDPFVSSQLLKFAGHDPRRYQEAVVLRGRARQAYAKIMADADVLVCPTVPVPAPRFDALTDADAMLRINRSLLRNTSLFNTLDAPAISIPSGAADTPAIGIMIAGRQSCDWQLLQAAAGFEAIFQARA